MAVVDVINAAGDKVSEVELSDGIFGVAVKKSVIHDVVKMQLANRRAGTASIKRRGEVRGSTKKLFRQKGTGNARAGSIKSPLRRGGGVIFGPKPKNWGYLVPKKVRRLALKMALSAKLSGEKMVVLDKIEMEKPKTKGFLSVAGALDLSSVLFVTAEKNENLELSTRNLKGVKVLRTEGLNVYDILKYEKIVLLEASIKGIEGRLL